MLKSSVNKLRSLEKYAVCYLLERRYKKKKSVGIKYICIIHQCTNNMGEEFHSKFDKICYREKALQTAKLTCLEQ